MTDLQNKNNWQTYYIQVIYHLSLALFLRISSLTSLHSAQEADTKAHSYSRDLPHGLLIRKAATAEGPFQQRRYTYTGTDRDSTIMDYNRLLTEAHTSFIQLKFKHAQ